MMVNKFPAWLAMNHPQGFNRLIWKSVLGDQDSKTLNAMTLDDGTKGWEYLNMVNKHSVELNGMNGILWGLKQWNNSDEWGFKLKDIVAEKPEIADMKMFIFCGKEDKVVDPKLCNVYKNVLLSDYGLNDVELIEYENTGHFFGELVYDDAFERVRDYIN